jgi:hypothetical protein
MPRPPEVFVRERDPDEAERLGKITRTAKDRAGRRTLRRRTTDELRRTDVNRT